jgi:SecD/SecF fusion protein
MSLDFISMTLLGQANQPEKSTLWLTLLLLVVALPLPIALGYQLAKWLRMKDYGWRLAGIFVAVCGSAAILAAGPLGVGPNLKRGVDLKGGVILVYEIDKESLKTDETMAVTSEQINWDGLIKALNKRVNPAGTKEIVIRRYGDWQVEIIVPEVDDIEIDWVRKRVETAGTLEFRIVANARDHDNVMTLAREQSEDPLRRRSRFVVDGQKKVGFWARVGREENPPDLRPLRVHVAQYLIRNASTGEIVKLPPLPDEDHAIERYLAREGIKDIDVLMFYDDGYNVTGGDLGMVSQGFDETMQPCVNFAMRGLGVGSMGGLTGSALPERQTEFYRLLGIMLDGELLSAPRVMSTISDRGRITGRFTQQEIQFLVGILQAGSLPAALKKSPISQNLIGAVLGEQEVRKGATAAVASLVAVILFMLYWYRLPGFIACAAMVANLVMVVATMIPISAPLTLPGLAGLVLTVGMSVDANVLIYERMREELDRGCALRMAIRNGFDRAWLTIFDSNITTILTAVILYLVGTDQLKGFGVTLTLGLLISMFTAVFCSRVAFEVFERKGIITRLRFKHVMTTTNYDFMGVSKLVFTLSAIVIVLGLVAAGKRGQQIFAVDFLGGSSVTMVLEQPTEEVVIREKLDQKFDALKVGDAAAEYSVNRVDVKGQPRGTWWKIDSSLPEEKELQQLLEGLFQVAHYSMDFGDLQEKEIAAPTTEKPAPSATGQKPAAPAESPAKPAQPADPEAKSAAQPPAEKPKSEPAETKPAETKPADAKPDAGKPAETPAASPAPEKPKTEKSRADEKKPDNARTDLPPPHVWAVAGAGDFLVALADAEEKPATEPAPKADAPAAETPAGDKPAEATAAKPAETPVAQPADERKAAEPSAEKPVGEKPAKAPAATDAAKPGVTEKPEPSKPAKPRIVTSTEVKFAYEINGRTLEKELLDAAGAVQLGLTAEDLNLRPLPDDPNWTMDDAKGYKRWSLSVSVGAPHARAMCRALKEKISKTPVWPSSKKIGSRVAADARTLAIIALLVSFVGIAIYVWIRFQHLIFGLGAVAALVHDVLMTVAFVAFSFWLARVLGFLQVEETKIDLNIIAALLTIVGYSINDTIVIFDRVREIRGKSPDLTSELFNTSLNQTLSRTILTSLTVFVVVLILFFFGGEGIHGFSFAMVIGTISGVYSTVYIASPLVLWMTPRKKSGGGGSADRP